jgi:two-component system KDP operon response regulator KdpE
MTTRTGGATVLVIEDDPATRDVLARELRLAGYLVVAAEDARSGMERFAARRPDLVLLDLGLPDRDGSEVIRAIRRESATPIVILSGRFDEQEKVRALEAGADDYVTKPFGVGELRARLKVALRHVAGAAGSADMLLRAGPIELDVEHHELRLDGVRVEVTPREFEILKVLLLHHGRIVTKGRLLRAVWGQAYQAEADYVYVHVSSLRRKLNQADPELAAGRLIVTEAGVGYRITISSP